VRTRADVLVPGSAVAFGLLTWSVAHIVTFALFARAPAAPSAFTHVPEGAGPLVVGVAFLLTTLAAAGAQASRASWTHRRGSGSITAAFAPAAFVAVESCEYLVRGGEAPPAALLLIGVVVHTAMGAATPSLWIGIVRSAVLVLSVEAAAGPAPTAGGRSAAVLDADRPATPPLRPAAGRGPPARSRHLRSPSCCA
jgi:hypothetical protein